MTATIAAVVHPGRIGSLCFFGGTALAFVLFLPFSVLATAIAAVIAVIPHGISSGVLVAAFGMVLLPLVTAPWAAAATVALGMPLAALLGLALRRVARTWIHVIAFAALGGIVGTVACLVACEVVALGAPTGWNFAAFLAPAAAAAAGTARGLMAGWSRGTPDPR